MLWIFPHPPTAEMAGLTDDGHALDAPSPRHFFLKDCESRGMKGRTKDVRRRQTGEGFVPCPSPTLKGDCNYVSARTVNGQ